MDNAAKALMIAGGILLAIIIITTGVYVWRQNANFINRQEYEDEQERITAFNKQYESYQKQALRGIDVLTVINKIRDNNIKNEDADELKITWNVILREDFTNEDSQIILKKGTHGETSSGSKITQILNNKKLSSSFKGLYFRCSSLEYNESTGRVNKIVFEQYISTDEIFNR